MKFQSLEFFSILDTTLDCIAIIWSSYSIKQAYIAAIASMCHNLVNNLSKFIFIKKLIIKLLLNVIKNKWPLCYLSFWLYYLSSPLLQNYYNINELILYCILTGIITFIIWIFQLIMKKLLKKDFDFNNFVIKVIKNGWPICIVSFWLYYLISPLLQNLLNINNNTNIHELILCYIVIGFIMFIIKLIFEWIMKKILKKEFNHFVIDHVKIILLKLGIETKLFERDTYEPKKITKKEADSFSITIIKIKKYKKIALESATFPRKLKTTSKEKVNELLTMHDTISVYLKDNLKNLKISVNQKVYYYKEPISVNYTYKNDTATFQVLKELGNLYYDGKNKLSEIDMFNFLKNKVNVDKMKFNERTLYDINKRFSNIYLDIFKHDDGTGYTLDITMLTLRIIAHADAEVKIVGMKNLVSYLELVRTDDFRATLKNAHISVNVSKYNAEGYVRNPKLTEYSQILRDLKKQPHYPSFNRDTRLDEIVPVINKEIHKLVIAQNNSHWDFVILKEVQKVNPNAFYPVIEATNVPSINSQNGSLNSTSNNVNVNADHFTDTADHFTNIAVGLLT